MLEKINEILDFWFHEVKPEQWWSADPAFDAQINERFGSLIHLAATGKLAAWLSHSLGCLAYIILLDQFPRNAYRGTPEAFAYDVLALAACKQGLENKLDRDLNILQRQFFYLPLMHAEDLDDQKLCIALFAHLVQAARENDLALLNTMEHALDYAYQHYDEIYHFGRFPRRNAVLKRENTQVEELFLSNQIGNNNVEYHRIRWACRRGMLELDLFLMPFFENCYSDLSQAEKALFKALLSEHDPILYAWLMGFEPVSKKEFSAIVDKIRKFRSPQA